MLTNLKKNMIADKLTEHKKKIEIIKRWRAMNPNTTNKLLTRQRKISKPPSTQ